jgi:hypothetical protein
MDSGVKGGDVDRIAMIVFHDEAHAQQGVKALKRLEASRKVALRGSVLFTRDESGAVRIVQRDNSSGEDVGLKLLVDSLSATLDGARTLGLDLSGSLNWMAERLRGVGIHRKFSEALASAMKPSSFVLLADVNEDDEAPLDDATHTCGGTIHRYDRRDLLSDGDSQVDAQTEERVDARLEQAQHRVEDAKVKLHDALQTLRKTFLGDQ